MSNRNKSNKEKNNIKLLAEKHSSKNKSLLSLCKIFFTWTSIILGLVISVLSLATRLSVYPLDSLDPKQPFYTPFQISNDGLIPLYKISTVMEIDSVKSAPMQTPFYRIAIRDTVIINKISFGNKSTFICCFPFDTLSSYITEADIHIRIRYKLPLVPIYRKKWFHFIAKMDVGNKLHWLLYPNSQNCPEYVEIVYIPKNRTPSNKP